MALSVKVGTFNARTTTGSQNTTGVGFQPKAVIFYLTERATAGVTTSLNAMAVGFASASTARAMGVTSRNGGTTTGNIDEENRQVSGALTLLNTFGTVSLHANLTSLDADGFTLDYTTVTANAYVIGYLALGGSDLTNVACGDFLTGTSTGDVDVTGLGFDNPDCVLMMHTMNGTALPDTNRTGSHFGFGVGLSSSARVASYRVTRDQTLNTQCASKQDDNAVLFGATDALSDDLVADYSGGITDGFRINISDAPGSTVRVAYLALKGGAYNVGLDLQKTSTGNQDSPALTGTPKAALFFAAAKTAGSTLDTGTDALTMFGASDGTTGVGIGARTADNVATADVYCEISGSGTILKANIAGSRLSAGSPSFSSGKYTINWTSADAVATEFGYLTFGDASAPPPATTKRKRRALTGVGR